MLIENGHVWVFIGAQFSLIPYWSLIAHLQT